MKLPASWKIALCLLIVALSSGWIGATLALRWQHHRMRQANAGLGQFGTAYLDRLDAYLELTPEQKAKFVPVLQRGREQIRAATGEIVAHTAKIRQQLKAELLPLLTPEQRQRLERLEETQGRLRERWESGERLSPEQRDRLRERWMEHSRARTNSTER